MKSLAAKLFGPSLEAILAETERAQALHGGFASVHEGYGVLCEEVAELLDAIRSNKKSAIRAEVIQVAAVAFRIAEWLEEPSRVSRDLAGRSDEAPASRPSAGADERLA